jgi:hypothetical protein
MAKEGKKLINQESNIVFLDLIWFSKYNSAGSRNLKEQLSELCLISEGYVVPCRSYTLAATFHWFQNNKPQLICPNQFLTSAKRQWNVLRLTVIVKN